MRLHPIDLPRQTAVTASRPGEWIIPKKPLGDVTPVAPVLIDPIPDQSDPEDSPIAPLDAKAWLVQGTNPITWTATGLPDGITLNINSGVFSGTPTTVGTFNVIVTATNAEGADAGPFDWEITAIPPELDPFPDQFNAVDVLITPVDATPYLAAGSPPIAWTATNLPTGITLDINTGIFTGTPTVVQTFGCTLTATNSEGFDAELFDWTISAAPEAPELDPFPNQSDPVSTPVTLDGTTSLAAGTPPITWTQTGGPTGLTLDPDSGIWNGTPSVVGVFNVTLTATNAQGFDTDDFDWGITAIPPLLDSPLPDQSDLVDVLITPLDAHDELLAGTEPITWQATGLPTGITLDINTGVYSGTPTAVGTFNCALTATNPEGFDTGLFDWVISSTAVAPILADPLPDQENEVDLPIPPYNANTQLLQGTAPITWTATGLPTGITLDTNTGIFNGTPTVAAIYNCTLTATNSQGFDTNPFDWEIIPSASLNVGLVSQADVNTRGQSGGVPYDHVFAVETSGVAGSPTVVADASGDYVGMKYDGATDSQWFTGLTPPDFMAADFTFACRLVPQPTWASGDVYSMWNDLTTATQFILFNDKNGSALANLWAQPAGTGGVQPSGVPAAFWDGAEHVMVATKSGNTWRLYVDDVLLDTETLTAGVSGILSRRCWGQKQYGGGSGLQGDNADCTMFWDATWTRVLTAAEITSLESSPNPFAPVLRSV